ncbi:MAG: hypothetical protein A2X94_05560 [Bdellovibrionales bacterium GWB1_55_8]|nr:MAG: hypothetical protein A2X94_05560 [Bdellovibrionales bacterium GWB1_55_8]
MHSIKLILALSFFGILSSSAWSADPKHSESAHTQVILTQLKPDHYLITVKPSKAGETAGLQAFTTLRYIEACSKAKFKFAKLTKFSTEPKINGKPNVTASLIAAEFHCVTGTDAEMAEQIRLAKTLCARHGDSETKDVCKKLRDSKAI